MPTWAIVFPPSIGHHALEVAHFGSSVSEDAADATGCSAYASPQKVLADRAGTSSGGELTRGAGGAGEPRGSRCEKLAAAESWRMRARRSGRHELASSRQNGRKI